MGVFLCHSTDYLPGQYSVLNIPFFSLPPNSVLRSQDPSVNVVLLEDMAAVIGVSVAMACMGLTSITGSHIPDAIGSCLIGGILAGVSGFIIYTNSAALVGK